MKLRDRLGWPVELIKGRPVLNFFRKIIHTSLWQTWKYRNGIPTSISHLEGSHGTQRSPERPGE